ncbi:MAG: hypothetical protein P8184_11335 [Calditrichia bacterium]
MLYAQFSPSLAASINLITGYGLRITEEINSRSLTSLVLKSTGPEAESKKGESDRAAWSISCGATAVHIAVSRVIPVSGLILFCPGIPLNLRAEKMSGSPFRVYMLGGEADYYLPKQKQLAAIFMQTGVPFIHRIIPGMEHGFPEDYEQALREAIKFVESE